MQTAFFTKTYRQKKDEDSTTTREGAKKHFPRNFSFDLSRRCPIDGNGFLHNRTRIIQEMIFPFASRSHTQTHTHPHSHTHTHIYTHTHTHTDTHTDTQPLRHIDEIECMDFLKGPDREIKSSRFGFSRNLNFANFDLWCLSRKFYLLVFRENFIYWSFAKILLIKRSFAKIYPREIFEAWRFAKLNPREKSNLRFAKINPREN